MVELKVSLQRSRHLEPGHISATGRGTKRKGNGVGHCPQDAFNERRTRTRDTGACIKEEGDVAPL